MNVLKPISANQLPATYTDFRIYDDQYTCVWGKKTSEGGWTTIDSLYCISISIYWSVKISIFLYISLRGQGQRYSWFLNIFIQTIGQYRV